jgi:hypothetical protein
MATLGLALSALVLTLGLWGRSFLLVPELFRLNKECQEQGYYMTEFEFKMVGIAYLMDHGEFVRATTTINRLHHQMKTKVGLVKVPKFSDKNREMDFYLDLQNPRTGAFMDDSYPYCTWEGPTGNVLLHLDELAKATGRPLKLKYPLRFYDSIDTPEKLKPYLDELGYIGWIGSKLPESTFHLIRDLASYARGDDVTERNGLHRFSPEWKRALKQWFTDNQDPETGFWGPRSRSTRRLTKIDLHNTGSIAKLFSDGEGNDLDPEFPLKLKERMFRTTLGLISPPPPAGDDLDDWHAYTLRQGKGVTLLTRHLWKGASFQDKARARELIEAFIRLKYERYYVAADGAFSYYPDSKHATIDGTGTQISNLDDAGAFSANKQRRIWGSPESTLTDLGRKSLAHLSEGDLEPLANFKGVNSVRYYASLPDTGSLTRQVEGVYYPRNPVVLDLVEVAPRMKIWLDSTSQSLGNWVSTLVTMGDMRKVGTDLVPVVQGQTPFLRMDSLLQDRGTLTVVGFDALQVPVCKLEFQERVAPRK